MSRSPARSDALTGDLFANIPAPMPEVAGTMDFRKPVAELVSQMLSEYDGSRYTVAARMSELADHETSKAILDSYTAPSRDECNLPLWKAPVIEIATGSRLLAEWHAQVLGGRILWGSDVLDAEIGQTDRMIAELQERNREMKQLRRRVR